MVSGIAAERVNEHVDVWKDQRLAIRSSSSLDRFRSTPGRVPPDAFEIGKCTRERGARCGSARIILSPSSIREVNVRPLSAAFFLALRSRSSESRIVVLMHQSIHCRHIYVDQNRLPGRVGPEEFHLEPLAEPDVNLSAHPAIRQTRRSFRGPNVPRDRFVPRQAVEELAGTAAACSNLHR